MDTSNHVYFTESNQIRIKTSTVGKISIPYVTVSQGCLQLTIAGTSTGLTGYTCNYSGGFTTCAKQATSNDCAFLGLCAYATFDPDSWFDSITGTCAVEPVSHLCLFTLIS